MNDPIDSRHALRTCIFTIVSRNYLHYALNLMEGVRVHLPGTRRVIVLCDARDGVDLSDADIDLLDIDALNIPHVDRMVYQYSILELNTAIKPFAFAALFARGDCDKVVYFDPDIQLFDNGTPLLERLDRADIVLTPHLTDTLDDDRHPSDLAILQSGTYNLGFLALRRSAQAAKLLQWWGQKLQRDCVVDLARGLFTDQKWMDLVPGLFDRVLVERDPGWNVAYWNLAHRPITRSHGQWMAQGRPLFFFHFSGYNAASRSISKHQDRFSMDQCSPEVQALFALYEANVVRQGKEHHARQPYAFACLADGTPLPDCARQAIRTGLDWARPLPDLRSLPGAQFLVDFLTGPADSLSPPISRLALQLYRARADLQAAFPDLGAAHRQAFRDWFAARAGIEAGVVGPLAAMRGDASGARPNWAGAVTSEPGAGVDTRPSRGSISGNALGFGVPTLSASVAAPLGAAGSTGMSSIAHRLAYRLAWQARHLLRPFSTLQMRQRARAYLVRKAYAPKAVASLAPGAPGPEPLPFGVTVVGYVQAESGVGESARATLRALAHTGLAHACLDFRAGNVSRMGETVDASLAHGRRHSVSLFHINADQLPLARAMLDESYFSVPHRIGFWAWELERFPAEWHNAFAHVDEVWVPSAFCQRAIAAVSPVPVLCVPHAIEVPEALSPDRARFGLRPSSRVFLAMADMMSIAARKNPLGAVEAFLAAFAGDTADVELVVKISNSSRDPEGLRRLRALAARHAGIHLIDDYLDRAALNSLIDSIDCFVSLHRSEGFGLSIAESMARGKVVLATGWSGNMDFMTPHNSMVVDFKLQTIAADCGPYRRGERWAEPNIDDAAAKMRRVAADASLRHTLGQRARSDCHAQLRPEVVGRQISERLLQVRQQKGL